VFLFATLDDTMARGDESMSLTRFGLQTKIITIIAMAVMFVVGVSTYIAMLLTRQLVEEEIYRKALAQAKATAHQLVDGEALKNPDKLHKLLRQMQRDLPGVRQADVYLHSPDLRLLATTSSQDSHLELDHLPNIEQYFEFERPDADMLTIETTDGKNWIMGTPIREQGLVVGCLNLKVSKRQSSIVTRGLVMRNLLLMLGSLTVVILVIHLFFLRSVRGPVKEMVRVMEAAEGGQLDVRARARNRDEIGLLAAHLNRMLVRIENFNIALGRKVQEATRELADRNEELRRINEELFETQKILARSERLAVAGQLAASLAHEIGTPLNSISGHVQLLARRKTWDDASERRLHIIENQIDNIVRTVKQLLSWTRKFDLRIEPLDLRHVVEESVLLSSPALQLRKIRVQMDLAAACPRIYGDAGYLQQVFLNLINNSMDAMPRGGQLRVTLRGPANGDPAAGPGPRELVVELADDGVGMSAETLARIFDPMFTTKRIGTGAGLGLAICDQIVRQHGGTIHVESEPNCGTRFTIILPLDCREKLEAVAGAPGAATANPAGS
jgi:two-component system NtrC family sensor kinase